MPFYSLSVPSCLRALPLALRERAPLSPPCRWLDWVFSYQLCPRLENLSCRVHRCITGVFGWMETSSLYRNLQRYFSHSDEGITGAQVVQRGNEEQGAGIVGDRTAAVAEHLLRGGAPAVNSLSESENARSPTATFAPWQEVVDVGDPSIAFHHALLTDVFAVPHQLPMGGPIQQVYEYLMLGRSPSPCNIEYTRCTIPEGQRDWINQIRLFQVASDVVFYLGEDGTYYSDSRSMYWYPMIEGAELFDVSETRALTRSAVRLLEHPSLIHIKEGLSETQRQIEGCEAVLLKDVPCYGVWEAQARSEVPYDGNHLTPLSQISLRGSWSRVLPYTMSNIFVMRIPQAGPAGMTYDMPALQAMFYAAYTSFYSIRQRYGNHILVHLNNWAEEERGHDGCLAYLIQLAAAQASGVMPITTEIYQNIELRRAYELFVLHCAHYREDTVEVYLTRLSEAAGALGFLYQLR